MADAGDDPGKRTLPPRALRLRDAVTVAALRRVGACGDLTFPAIPALIEEYVGYCARVFAALGRRFDALELARLREGLLDELAAARAEAPYANVVVHYHAGMQPGVEYMIERQLGSLAQEYAAWAHGREGPFFGSAPDQRVVEVAGELPAGSVCLDVGAGVGRNALALAKAGLEVDAVEPAGTLADRLEQAAAGLAVRVLRMDVLAVELAPERYALIVASQVTSHLEGAAGLRGLVERLAAALARGGAIVMNLFVAERGYVPDSTAREFAPRAWSTFFTRSEVDAAIAGLGLTIASDVPMVEYEKARQQAWPPTDWYEGWASGHDLFPGDPEGSPITMRWLVIRRA